ncbi:MAG: membrane protease subunit HflC [Zhongshania aliphaticivorans]|jgi:membrane protease subunit HflC|uniref:Protein HflC n=1 Tax=Zhongshania aliphaticivorans TaxID=1470434 RepID=A0A127M2J6_9GAMM|nr:protease modulator HflC [Zhongshania aliphaticivorans]AMO67449.1 protease modulator HflC [Zhongshania aliphaticivorans]EIF42955.1 membrane bound protease regulator HflC [gamma proteobacterium BDW918]|tara:strand:+ start:36049 stop:36921 length:873 start_codon:yes stop_codon:yes gene_type:complete
MGGRNFTVVVVLLGLIVLAFNSLYIVRETERGVLLKFGEVVDPDISVGLHIKTPFVHMVRKFERRILTLDAPTQRFLTIEKKPLDVDFYAKWKVIDTQKFYTATNGEEGRAEGLLAQRINTGLRNKFGERTFHEVVSGERDLLMTDLTRDLNQITTSEFGIQLVDVRVKRIDLPSQVSQSVFDRMKSEREREAREHRSTGRELAEKIRATADRQRTVIGANAYRDSEVLRGEGDALAARTYAAAYNRDPEFYSFLRSLSAYQSSFSNKGDLLVVDSKSEFFRYMKQGGSK